MSNAMKVILSRQGHGWGMGKGDLSDESSGLQVQNPVRACICVTGYEHSVTGAGG
jgi:hypothetical protein